VDNAACSSSGSTWGRRLFLPAADARRIESIAAAINVGYADHALLAHDVCTKAHLKRNGSGGHAYISNVTLPGRKAKGISDETFGRSWLTPAP